MKKKINNILEKPVVQYAIGSSATIIGMYFVFQLDQKVGG